MVSILNFLRRHIFLNSPNIEKTSIKDITQKVLEMDNIQNVLLYVNIPFCIMPCDYLTTTGIQSFRSRIVYKYLAKLTNHIYELEALAEKVKIENVIIGGGIATALDVEDLEDIIMGLFNVFNIHGKLIINADISDLLEAEKVDGLYSVGVDAINIQIPSTSEDELNRFERQDISLEDIREAVKNLRRVGFSKILFTTTYLFPGNKITLFQKTLSELFSLEPFQMLIKPFLPRKGTHIYEMVRLGKIERGQCKDFLKYTQKVIETTYEQEYCFITTRMVAKQKKNILGNFEYLTSHNNFIGIGAQMISKLDSLIYRYPTIGEFLSHDKLLVNRFKIDKNIELINSIITALFNLKKISIKKIEAQYYDIQALRDTINLLESLSERGYLSKENDFVAITDRGLAPINLLMHQLNRYFLKR
ncbi:MAG: radical SAM protein [Candidatus Asgardarchaeia archaeon]